MMMALVCAGTLNCGITWKSASALSLCILYSVRPEHLLRRRGAPSSDPAHLLSSELEHRCEGRLLWNAKPVRRSQWWDHPIDSGQL